MNRESLKVFLLSVEPEVQAWFSRRVISREDVDDLVQECMRAIIESHERYQGRSTMRTWVMGICRNLLYRYLHEKRVRPTQLRAELPGRQSAHDLVDVLGLHMAAEVLPSRLRTVYDLHYKYGKTIREVSVFLRRSEGTVKYQLYEIRSRLRSILAY